MVNKKETQTPGKQQWSECKT